MGVVEDNIRVVCRFRPQSKNEIEKEVGDINPIVSFDDDMMSVKVEVEFVCFLGGLPPRKMCYFNSFM